MTPDNTRRTLLRGLSVSPFAVTGVGVAPRAARAQAQAAGLIAPNACIQLADVAEGPYYIDPAMVRPDIASDRPGVPLEMKLQVVDTDCRPLAGARVDVWHCDARGVYSEVPGPATVGQDDTRDDSFLRGTQGTDDRGIATFSTIYPGWYPGRTPHIHYKVFLDEFTVLTSQVFFPDALSDYLYKSVAPYNERADTRDTINASDQIAHGASDGAFAFVREQTDGYVAALVVGVSRDARPPTGRVTQPVEPAALVPAV